MPDWAEPGQRWRLLVPAGALVVDAGTVAADRSAADLPSGATVVLVGARRRVRAPPHQPRRIEARMRSEPDWTGRWR